MQKKKKTEIKAGANATKANMIHGYYKGKGINVDGVAGGKHTAVIILGKGNNLNNPILHPASAQNASQLLELRSEEEDTKKMPPPAQMAQEDLLLNLPPSQQH